MCANLVHMGMGQNPVPLVNIKIAGKWMSIPLKIILIGIDPYPHPSPKGPNGPKAHRCRDAERRHWVHCPKGGKENRETSDLPKRCPESLQGNPKPKHV